MSPLRPLRAAGVALLLVVGLAACGVEADQSGPPRAAAPEADPSERTREAQERREAARVERRREALPDPVANTVVVAGEEPLSISEQVRRGFSGRGGTSVRTRRVSDRAAFRDLCNGRADIVETDRLISEAEIAACARNGLEVLADPEANQVRPIQLAAEGIVIATKNESDVGGDCLRRNVVRDIFRAGSSINNWSQVGFGQIPLTTTGRGEDSDVFQLFGGLVLGAQSDAQRTDVRADYREQQTSAQVRNQITGAERERRLRRESRVRLRRSLVEARPERRRAVLAAERRADAVVLRAITRENRARSRRNVTLTEAQADRIERRNRVRVEDAKRLARRRADQAIIQRITREENRRLQATLRAQVGPGQVGFFRFTYYELYEDQLRPIEIWDPVISQSVLEASGVATTRTRAEFREQEGVRNGLGGTSQTRRATPTPTPTTPGAQYISASGRQVTVPATGPIDVDRTPSCVFPSRRTITSGVYPFSVRLLAYTTTARLEREEVRSYLSYWLEEGQDIVAEERLIPLDDGLRQDEFTRVTGRRSERLSGGSGALPEGESSIDADDAGALGNSTPTPSTTTPGPSASPGTTTTTPASPTPLGGSGATPGVGGGG